ncbi:MAG: hypothetical protein ACJARP_001105 [Vicingaceae bacterium]|jgi:hypothetical protein
MNFKRPLFFIQLLIFALLVTQCKEDDDNSNGGGNKIIDGTLPQPTDTIYVDNELKKYYYFGEGSWRVYKRTDTNVATYDTATLVKRESRILYERIDYPTAWEYAFTGISHSYYSSLPRTIEPKLQVSTANLNKQMNRINMFSQKTLFKNVSDFFSLPIDSISMLKKSNDNTFLIDIDNLITSNYNFANTIHIKFGRLPSFRYEIWISKSIGLTKYFNPGDNNFWELINYEIKP